MEKNLINQLKTHELLAELPQESLSLLVDAAVKLEAKKLHTLFVQDDPANLAYFILSGWVKLFRHTIDGEEYIVDILPSRHIFGLDAMFCGNHYSYGAEIVEDAILLTFPLAIYRKLLDTVPGFSSKMLEFQVRQQVKSEKEREHVVIQNVPQRIGCFLLQLLSDKQATSATLHLPYDKTLLAARLGMQRETLSRGLATLQKEGIVAMHGASVEIPDIRRLSQFSCEMCTHNFPC